MRGELKKILAELQIEVVPINMEELGCYIPTWKKIFVNENLCEDKMKQVIYHELKHVLDHNELLALYDIPIYHSKMESEAKLFMINQTIKENDGQYNYTELISKFGIHMGYDSKFAQ